MRFVDLWNECHKCTNCIDIVYADNYAYGTCSICGHLWSNDGKYISCRLLDCPGHSDKNEPKKEI